MAREGFRVAAAFVEVFADSSRLDRDMAAVSAKLDKDLRSRSVVIGANDSRVNAAVDSVRARLEDLRSRAATVPIDANDKAAIAKIAGIRVKLDELGSRTARPNIDLQGVAKVEAEALAVDASLAKIGHTEDNVGKSSGNLAGKFSNLGTYGMGTLIGSAIALSPVLVTVGFGLIGLGAAAFGAIS